MTATSQTPILDKRRLELCEWIKHLAGGIPFDIEPASSDASFRRYFRITPTRPLFKQTSLIAMDAPPDKEPTAPFVRVASLMREKGVNAPEVFIQDSSNGFLLLQDFGNVTYQTALERGANPKGLYLDAIDMLVRWQRDSRPRALPDYDEALLRNELNLFPEWYVTKYKKHDLTPAQIEMLEKTFFLLIENARMQPQVYVHRDYHSRNLMVTPENNPGVLDFQDAVFGPVTYDLVSLLRDAYVEWSEEQQLDWAIRYWERVRSAKVPVSPVFDQFWREYEWMGVQRHLKVVGIFSRLAFRDGKHRYLNDIPRVLGYLRKTCARYAELTPLLRFIDLLNGTKTEIGFTF